MQEAGATVSTISEGLLYYRRHRENFLKYESEVTNILDQESLVDG
jgi:hypothetical protein